MKLGDCGENLYFNRVPLVSDWCKPYMRFWRYVRSTSTSLEAVNIRFQIKIGSWPPAILDMRIDLFHLGWIHIRDHFQFHWRILMQPTSIPFNIYPFLSILSSPPVYNSKNREKFDICVCYTVRYIFLVAISKDNKPHQQFRSFQ